MASNVIPERREKIGCIIMASGMGQRFGGNKLTAQFCGRPMIEYILDATEQLFDARIVVTRHTDAAAIARRRGIPCVLHDYPARSDAVWIGMQAMDVDIDQCMFCPSDQPLLTGDTIRALIECGHTHPDSICRIACGDAVGAPVLFPRWTFRDLMNLPRGKGGGWIAQRYPDRVRLCRIENADQLRDVDAREDLEPLERTYIQITNDQGDQACK